jgi:hypothetical protein
MPPGVNGFVWGFGSVVDDGSIPVGIALMVAGALFAFLYRLTWARPVKPLLFGGSSV